MSDRRAQGRAVTAWLTADAYAELHRVSVAYGLSMSALTAMAVLDLLASEQTSMQVMSDDALKNLPLSVKH